jgi:hypothetical protein
MASRIMRISGSESEEVGQLSFLLGCGSEANERKGKERKGKV